MAKAPVSSRVEQGIPGLIPLSVVVGSTRPEIGSAIKDRLANRGDIKVCPIDDIVTAVETNPPSAIILEGERFADGVQASVLGIAAKAPRPIVVIVQSSAGDEARQATQMGATSFVVGDAMSVNLENILDVSMERFRLTDALYTELRTTKEQLAARKVIERAKGLVMERSGLSEKDAYDSLRKMAMAQGKPLKQIAETVVSVAEIFQR